MSASEETRRPVRGSGGEVADRVRVVLRPVGSGLPLGFFAFGIGMAVLGGYDIGLVPRATLHQVGWMLITFVAPVQLVASVIAFMARDSVGATGLGLFAASWATIGTQFVLGRPGVPSPALGLYLAAFAVAVALLGVAASKGQPLIATILLTASVRSALAAAYELGGYRPLLVAGGIIGLVVTVLGFYSALGFLLEDGAHHTVLPLGRRGDSRTAVGGTFAQQVEHLEAEAGVRRSL